MGNFFNLNKEINYVKRYLAISPKVHLSIGIFLNDQEYYFSSHQDYNYHIGSITKTFTALLTLKIAHTLNIDLNTTVDRFIPSLKKGHYPTIYQCLTHTSGYHKVSPVTVVIPNLFFGFYSCHNIYQRCTNNTVLRFLNFHRHFKIKTTYHYSDVNLAILALVLESITHRSYSELIVDFIRNDLKLPSTYLLPDRTNLPESIWHHLTVKDWCWRSDNPFLAGGGITSTCQDMVKYMRYLITSREPYVLSIYDRCQESIKPNSTTITTKAFHSYINSNRLWHIGGTSTFRSMVIFNREKRFGVVVLSNSRGRPSANACYICQALYTCLKRHKIKNLDFLKAALPSKK